MTDPNFISARSNFDILMRFAGWGDPSGGLWVIGLEESGYWKTDAEIAAFRQRKFLHMRKSVVYECSPAAEVRIVGHFGRTRIPQWEAKIAATLSATNSSWPDYLAHRLWVADSRTFHSNLYPLGKQSLRAWPEQYEMLFGFSRQQRDAYLRQVRQIRFPLVRAFWRDEKPQATICFGRTGWEDFRALLELDLKTAERPGTGRFEAHSGAHVLLAPFFGMGKIRNSDVEQIALILKNWGVCLP